MSRPTRKTPFSSTPARYGGLRNEGSSRAIANLRNALIAAHNRVVTVRVVGDNGASVNREYAPFYNALVAK
jgi:hypothetical protein